MSLNSFPLTTVRCFAVRPGGGGGRPPSQVFEWLAAHPATSLPTATCWKRPVSSTIEIIQFPRYDGRLRAGSVMRSVALMPLQKKVIGCTRGGIPGAACRGSPPGSPYLSGLPPELATPPISPRKEVPTGSIGIGNPSMFVVKSPGGWNIRADACAFRPGKSARAFFCVQATGFVPSISRDEFAK